MIAAVKVRGDVDAREKVKRTFENLSLEKKNQVRIMKDNKVNIGMLKVVKDYVAYGEVSEETLESLKQIEGRAEEGDVISLSPPSGGYRGTKKNSSQGGSLGHHKNIDELIMRMV